MITNQDLRQVSIQTPVLNRVAGPLGFDIAFTLPNENLRPVQDQMVDVGGEMVPVMVSCVGTDCTVTIPTGSRSLNLLFVPTPMVDTMGTGFTGEFGTPTVIDETTGEISIQTPTLDTAAPSGGTPLMFTLQDNFEPVTGQPVTCIGTDCTVTIPQGSTSLALMFVPVTIPQTDPPPEPVAIVLPPEGNNVLLPDFFVGFDTSVPTTTDPATGEVTFTFVSETNAPAGGLAVSFRITGPAFTARLPNGDELVCPGNVCTVRILEDSTTAAFILVPQGTATTRWSVAIVPDTTNNYGFNDDSQTSVAVITTPPPAFFVGFSTPEPTVVNPENGEVTFTFVSETNAPAGGLAVSFRITGPAFTARLPNGDELICPQDVCTVRILEDSTTAAFILVPQGTATTRWSVAIVPDTTNNYGFNDDSQTSVAVTTIPPPAFVVGFSGTPTPTTDPVTGEVISGDVTFTVVSDTPALVGGLEVTITIGGDAFIAIPLNADGTRMNTALDCPLNVCTITIPAGSDRAAFVLVPDGPRSPDSDLFERWTVAIVLDDTDNCRLLHAAADGGADIPEHAAVTAESNGTHAIRSFRIEGEGLDPQCS